MKRREFSNLVLGGLVSAAAPALGQPRVRHIGVLIDGPQPHPMIDILVPALAELGYVEGSTMELAARYTEGRSQRAPALAAELVKGNVEVIVAYFTPAVRAAMQASQTIPIIMAPAGAPVESGLVASLSRPGGNVTGVTNMAAELGPRRLQMLKDVVPGLQRVAVLASTHDPFTRPLLHYTQAAAQSAGIAVDARMVGGPADFAAAFAAMGESGTQAVIVPSLFNANRAEIAALALRYRLASVSIDRELVQAGGLMSIAASASEIWRRAAWFVDRVLKGARAAELPVEQPTAFEIAINLRTANALNLKVPERILFAADEVIQ